MLTTQRYYQFGFATLLVLLSFSFFFGRDEAVFYEHIVRVPYRSPNPPLRSTVLHLFDAIKHDPSKPLYRAPSGTTFEANSTSTWPKPLGKRVLIVDIDTRVPTGNHQILNPATIDFEKLDMHAGGDLVSQAMINHYLYALIHGYDYKFYQAQKIPDHHDTWILPHVLRELIPDYQFVVTMDADAMMSHLDLPLEWMFNRWGIANHTSIAMPWDTMETRGNASISVDSKGLRVLNTGFVAVQNNALTLRMLDAWRDCTSDTRYPGCSAWKTTWSHEQRAFSEYIRYDFNSTPETVVSIPCDDAVGWPGFIADVGAVNLGISDCNGRLVRHYTIRKEKAKEASGGMVMQALSELLQKSLLGEGEGEGVWYKEPEKKNEGEGGDGEAQTEVREDEKKKGR